MRLPSTCCSPSPSEPTPPLLPVEGHAPYRLPPYDDDAMLTEALLLTDWFWPALHGRSTPEEVRNAYVDAVAAPAEPSGSLG